MKQKQVFIILGTIGFVFLLFWFVALALIIKTMRGSNEDGGLPVVEMTLCDEDASDLCVVTFGANKVNRMVINFQLPNPDYEPFYVKVDHRGTVSVYTCEVAESVPTSAYCSGVRTPLGEVIDIDVYTTGEDKLIAHGTFLVSAIALATPISLPENTSLEDGMPTSAPVPGDYVPSTQMKLMPTPFIPGTAYPNP
jgi:hypothetical protein